MKKSLIFILLIAIIGISCRSTSKGIFSKKTPHEKYEEKLEDNGLEETPEGRQWLAASKAALQDPQLVQLPYSHAGNFPKDKPRAIGLKFSAIGGEKLTFTISKNAGSNFVLYAELYKQDGDDAQLLRAADTAKNEFSYAIDETGSYILRLQPELFRTGIYNLSISVGPSLGFPVTGNKANVGSLWGAQRDGGKRNHEGIDIFAPKGTPAIAAADGYITGVREGGIGGKTVWLRPTESKFTLYYAHLDEQLVQEGQLVKKGDTVGLVGNTGNAQTTAAHLHFGIYGSAGAVDPFPFVNRKLREAPAMSHKKLADHMRLIKTYKAGDLVVKANTLVVPLAINSKGYIAELPDGKKILTSFASVQLTTQPIKKTKAIVATPLYNAPGINASSSLVIQPGRAVAVLGYFNEFVFVRAGEKEGWVLESDLI